MSNRLEDEYKLLRIGRFPELPSVVAVLPVYTRASQGSIRYVMGLLSTEL